MIAESIKRDIGLELIMVESSRDLKRIFADADEDFRRRHVPAQRRKEVLEQVRVDLKILIDRTHDPKSVKLIAEAEAIIDGMLR